MRKRYISAIGIATSITAGLLIQGCGGGAGGGGFVAPPVGLNAQDTVVSITESPLETVSTGGLASRTLILLTFNDSATDDDKKQVIGSVGGRQIGFIARLNLYQIEIPDTGAIQQSEAVVDRLRSDPQVKAATLNFVPARIQLWLSR